jgi:hypothetical protein
LQKTERALLLGIDGADHGLLGAAQRSGSGGGEESDSGEREQESWLHGVSLAAALTIVIPASNRDPSFPHPTGREGRPRIASRVTTWF